MIICLSNIIFYNSSYAHDADGYLPITASATNVWFVSCSDDGNGVPTTLEVAVDNKTAKGPMLSLQVITYENTPKFFNLSDPIGGDSIPSSQISSGFGGNHLIVVDKSGIGVLSYHFSYHCMSNGTHTGTDIQQIQ